MDVRAEEVAVVRKTRSHLLVWLTVFTLTFLVSFIGAQASFTGLESWYSTIKKPAFTPPGWLFGPVWTVLYAMMATAASLVLLTRAPGTKGAMLLYWAQLVANGLWSVLFFGLRRPDLALLDIAILLVLIVLTMISFFRIRSVSGWLLVPYLLWVGFATILNAAIWNLNR